MANTKEGDKHEIIKKDGGLCPIVVYSKSKMEKIEKIAKEADKNKKNVKAYDNVAEMFADMRINLDNI